MVFSSIVFIFYFLPVVLILYYTIGKAHISIRNILLLTASIIFYAWGEPKNVILLIVSCIINWALAMIIEKWKNSAKLFVVITCIFNLGMLFLFKYWDFAMTNINAILGEEVLPLHHLALPIGISFFTFQAMSYVIDVYRGCVKVQKNPLYVALYVTMFPQLVAGPIVRYSSIEKQILHRNHTWSGFSAGCVRFVQGFAKKLILANSFAIIADTVYSLSLAGHNLIKIPILLAWMGSFAYTLQIYFDFSAYSDMAIGLGKMFGFEFEENFRYPYISKSISEFWRRWHISLSSWFKDYVYFPLGGSRVETKDKMLANLLVVWMLTGLWHGASWSFLMWGLLNFVFVALEHLTGFEKWEVRGLWKHIYALFVVNMGWVLFRCETLYHLGEYIGNMFGVHRNGFYSPYVGMFFKEFALVWIVGILLCMPIGEQVRTRLMEKGAMVLNVSYVAAMVLIFVVSILYLVKSGYNPFIYFNF